MNMIKRILTTVAIVALAGGFAPSSALSQAAPVVSITRLDCGTYANPSDVSAFSDTHAFDGFKVQLVFSCYLVRHGDDYLVWDTGNPTGTAATSPKTSLVDLLAQLKLTPAQVKFVAISHYHGDHTGQVGSFPASTLLIGKGDWDAISAAKAGGNPNPAPFANWLTGGGKVEPQPADRDIFGDGTVVMLNMPGHTPGHHSLLVKLKEMGNVLITGDLAHFHENYDSNGIPTFNTDRAQSLASIDRFKKLATNLKATVIIQHDARDVSKLPAFPAAAK